MTAIVEIRTACDASSAAVVLENDENKGGTASRRPSSNSRFGSTRGPQTAHPCRKTGLYALAIGRFLLTK